MSRPKRVPIVPYAGTHEVRGGGYGEVGWLRDNPVRVERRSMRDYSPG